MRILPTYTLEICNCSTFQKLRGELPSQLLLWRFFYLSSWTKNSTNTLVRRISNKFGTKFFSEGGGRKERFKKSNTQVPSSEWTTKWFNFHFKLHSLTFQTLSPFPLRSLVSYRHHLDTEIDCGTSAFHIVNHVWLSEFRNIFLITGGRRSEDNR